MTERLKFSVCLLLSLMVADNSYYIYLSIYNMLYIFKLEFNHFSSIKVKYISIMIIIKTIVVTHCACV